MRTQAAIEITATAIGIGIMLAFGCSSIRPAIDAGIEAREAYEAKKEAERQAAIDKAEAERQAAEEAERIRNTPPDWNEAPGGPSQLAPGAAYRVNRDGDDWYFVYIGGEGLYKPESRLWLVGGVKASQVKTAGEYRPNGTLVKFLRLGGNEEPYADGKQPIKEAETLYHAGRLKLRDAKVSANGNTLRAILRDGRIIEKRIVDREVRQE